MQNKVEKLNHIKLTFLILIPFSTLFFIACADETKKENTTEKVVMVEEQKNTEVSSSDSSNIYFNYNWTKLSQKDGKLIIYNPCSYDIPEINIQRDTLIIKWSSEKTIHLIDSIEQDQKNNFVIFARDYIYNKQPSKKRNNSFQVSAKFINERMIYHFSWKMNLGNNEYGKTNNWLMIPTDSIKNYPYVDNKCPNERKMEMVLDKIDFDKY